MVTLPSRSVAVTAEEIWRGRSPVLEGRAMSTTGCRTTCAMRAGPLVSAQMTWPVIVPDAAVSERWAEQQTTKKSVMTTARKRTIGSQYRVLKRWQQGCDT